MGLAVLTSRLCGWAVVPFVFLTVVCALSLPTAGWGASTRRTQKATASKQVGPAKTAKAQTSSRTAKKSPARTNKTAKKRSGRSVARKASPAKKQVAGAKRSAPRKASPRRVARRSPQRPFAKHPMPAIENPPAVLAAAEQYLGRPYRFGGRSASGIDCSGLTRAAFADVGVDLPHSAREQFQFGGAVDRSELQPGDLVFFSTYRRGASHVGIYAGEGYFVHAASRGRQVRFASIVSKRATIRADSSVRGESPWRPMMTSSGSSASRTHTRPSRRSKAAALRKCRR
jgi:cell wall-associated NlpC family hydrolase